MTFPIDHYLDGAALPETCLLQKLQILGTLEEHRKEMGKEQLQRLAYISFEVRLRLSAVPHCKHSRSYFSL